MEEKNVKINFKKNIITLQSKSIPLFIPFGIEELSVIVMNIYLNVVSGSLPGVSEVAFFVAAPF